MCSGIFPSYRELQADSKSTHQSPVGITKIAAENGPRTVPENLETANTSEMQPGLTRAESTARREEYDRQATEPIENSSTNADKQAHSRKRTATPKVTSYREDSDGDFSSPSSSDDEIIPKAQKDQNQTTPEHPIWVEPPSIKDGEIQYKCRVCPRIFCTRGYCAKHFNNHPTYLP